MIFKEPLVKEFLEEHEDGVIFYRVYSASEGGKILQEETNIVYDEVAVTDDDPYTYSEIIVNEDEDIEEDIEDEEMDENI